MSFSQQEKAYYDQLFNIVDKDDSGVLPGQDALPFLMAANLPQQQLGEVWAIADPENNGFLTKDAWYKAARLIGWLQKGGKSVVDEQLAAKAGPYPTFSGHPPPPSQPSAPLSAQPTGQSLPPVTAADRAKFTKIFVGCGPSNGLVSGDKARDVFLKSKLDFEKLGQIWNLADTQGRGSLDLTDFIIGMYLIQNAMANPSLVLPQTLPQGTYEAASGGRMPPTSPIARQNTGPASPIRAQYTGQPLQPQRTGSMSAQPTGPAGIRTPTRGSTLGPSSQFNQQWDVTPDAKSTSDRFFSQLDPQNRGFIEGDVAVPFMLQSQLDEGTLASIWDLADIRKEGRLNKDEFAVAMYLINGKLAGRDVPGQLPNSLIPPSLRGEYGGAGGGQEVVNQPSSATKDLFDLFADDPPLPTSPPPGSNINVQGSPTPIGGQGFNNAPSVFIPQPPSRKGSAPPPPPASRGLSPMPTGQYQQQQQQQQQYQRGPSPAQQSYASPPPPPSDLLGDDSAPAPVPDQSAEIGNKRNQLENTTRGLSQLEKEHDQLAQSDKSTSAELAELEEKLRVARAKHESETKVVSELRTRVSEQKERIQTVNMDFIAAQSDVSALQSEKDELEQALLGDKEEIRGLQQRMKEVEEEKKGLGMIIERLKKEARQQKGMVSIAKKQLSTAEGGRDSVQGEIRALEREAEEAQQYQHQQYQQQSPQGTGGFAAGVPLPTTPQALSPAATGVSQRSNNPFDRLRGVTSPPLPSPPVPVSAPAPVSAPGQSAEGIENQFQPRSLSPQSSGPGTGAMLGAGAALGAAAGLVVAGAETLYDAAKEVVSPSENKDGDGDANKAIGGADSAGVGASVRDKETEGDEAQPGSDGHAARAGEADPFGADGDDADPFGAPGSNKLASNQLQAAENKPELDAFGMPIIAQHQSSNQAQGQGFDNLGSSFDDGFGDSFASSHSAALGASDTNDAPAANTNASTADFDSAFADFDNEPPSASITDGGLPSGIPKSAVAYLRPDPERSDSTRAVMGESEPPSPGGVLSSAPGTYSASASDVGAGAGAGAGDAGVGGGQRDLDHEHEFNRGQDADDSSDEDDGPEDLDGPAPKRYLGAVGGVGGSDNTPVLYPPVEQVKADIDADVHDRMDVAESEAVPSASVAHPTSASSASPVDVPKTRRSAPPPPPSAKTTLAPPIDDFDPFGTGASPASQSKDLSQSVSDPFGSGGGEGEGEGENAGLGGQDDSFARAYTQEPAGYNAESAGVTSEGQRDDASAGFGDAFGTNTLPPGAAPAAFPGSTLGQQQSSLSTLPQPQPTFATGFDDDDFDFSDQPPVRVDAEQQARDAHALAHSGQGVKDKATEKDDFDFDDEFDQPSTSEGSNGMSKSYELVSPPVGAAPQQGANQPQQQQQQGGGGGGAGGGGSDEWGFNPSATPGSGFGSAFGESQNEQHAPTQTQTQSQSQGQGGSGFSFDDAFGGDFEPAPAVSAPGGSSSNQPPASTAGRGPGGALSPPALPERRDSGVGAQPDDIEDVKKLCSMGFPRSLVVEALAANSYDFQKTLNVLLQ